MSQARNVPLVLLATVLVLSTAVFITVFPQEDVDIIETSIVGIGSFDDYAVGLTVTSVPPC